jgi:RHS repeat-associated protein
VPRRQLVVVAVAFFSFAYTSHAQVASVADDTAAPVPGAGHDYIHLLSETVNPASGTLSLSINLPMPKSRGLTLPVAITYNSGAAGHPIPGNGYAYGPGTAGWWNTLPTLQSTWQAVQYPPNVPDVGSSGETCYFSYNYVFSGPDGAGHDLGLASMSPPPFQPGADCSEMGDTYPNFTTWNYGGDSQVYATFTQICPQSNGSSSTGGSGCWDATPPVVVFDKNGSIYTFQPGQGTSTTWPRSIEDRNGNIVTFKNGANYGDVTATDTAGRQLISITNPVLGGDPFNPSVYTVGGLSYDLTYTSVPQSMTAQFKGLPPTLPNGYQCTEPAKNSLTPTAVKTLTLPNGRSYTFSYDPTYGLINQITYPDGGWVKYTWKMSDTYSEADSWSATPLSGTNGAPITNYCNALYTTPVVATRQVGFSTSTTPVMTQTFTYNTTWETGQSDTTWSSKQTTVMTTDNVRNLTSKTVYTYSFVGMGQPTGGFSDQGNIGTQVAVESQVLHYDWGSGSPGALLKTENQTWADMFDMTQDQTVYNISGKNTSEVDYAYGFGGLVTQKTEYDFGQGSRGGLLRTTVNTPQTFAANPLFPYSSSNYPSTLMAFPCQTIIYQGAVSPANRIAETDYLYDNASSTCATPGAATVSAVSNLPTGTHDETCYGVTRGTGCPGTGIVPRGNITSVVKQCLQSCTNSTTTYTYDETGQILSSTDPCGNGSCGDILNSTNHTTSFTYLDSYTPCSGAAPPSGNTNAYLTQVTDALGHIEKYCYGYTDGQVRGITDVNSLTTTYKYADSLDRLTETDLPNGGQTLITYNDSVPSVSTSKKITTTQSLTTETIMDGVGHPIETELTSDPQGVDYTVSTYDGEGKLYTVSNPYRTTSDGTYGLTTYTYDGLERPTKELEPDGSSIVTAYCGSSTKVTDEAGKWRRSTSDGLGRLIEVDEPNSVSATVTACPASGDPTWITNYGYDSMSDLVSVVQGGSRNRTFTYDSLGRLTTATNPESGTVSYVYDLNGNVVTKANANGKSDSYDYDVLNRELYENPSPWDDSPKAFTYDVSTNCAVVPRCANVGQLVEPANYIGYYIYSYDPVDRQTAVSVGMSGVYKTTLYQYNYDDSLASVTYPSGRVVNYTVDSAGRPSVAQDSSTSVFYAQGSCASGVGSNGVCYSANGSIAQLENGTNIVTTTVFNQRLQPCWIFATTGTPLPWQANDISCSSTASPAGNLLDLKYNFGTTSNNGNVLGITNNRDTTRNENFTYDQVNRLLSASTNATSGSKCWGQSYTYDQWANLTGVGVTQCSAGMLSATVNTKNQITSGGMTYDASGNVTSDGVRAYVWYADGRLASAAGTTSYLYDADGNRIEKVTNGTLSKMYWYGGGSQALDESGGSGNITDEYIYFGSRRVAHILAATGVVDFYVQDSLGTSRTLVQNGQTSLCYDADFLPYGAENALTSTCAQNYKFTGKERDSESGNDDFGARYFASTLGRFLAPDFESGAADVPNADLGSPQTLNLYSYVGNNPLNLTDPDGHHQECGTTTSRIEPSTGEMIVDAHCFDVPDFVVIGGVAVGHHFVDQALIRAKGAWDTFSGSFFRNWITGPIKPGTNYNDGLHRLNSAQIRQIIEEVESREGPMAQWGENAIKEAVDAVRNAGGDVQAFLDRIEKENPTARTVRDDVSSILDQAKAAYDSASGAVREGLNDVESTPYIGPVVESVEEACETQPNCGLPPP